MSDELIAKFKEFCTLSGSKDPTQMTSKASGKLVVDCWEKDYKKFDVKSMVDASVFSACKEKGKPHMAVNKENVDKYMTKTAHEIAKKKKKTPGLAATDPEVATVKDHLTQLVCGGGPKVKEVKQSATGNVAGLTDAKGYTGSHAQRFGADGKGKGIEGRSDKVDSSGYVGNYKGAGTFDKKK